MATEDFAETYLEPALEPWLNPGLEIYAGALGMMFDPLSRIIGNSATDPGWGSILNPSTFPGSTPVITNLKGTVAKGTKEVTLTTGSTTALKVGYYVTLAGVTGTFAVTTITSATQFVVNHEFTKADEEATAGKVVISVERPQYTANYLGQFVGVLPPPGLTKAEDLLIIAEEQGFARGTPRSLIVAAQRALKTGSEAPRLLERQNASGEAKAYRFVIIARAKNLAKSIVTTGNVTSGSAQVKSTITAGMELGATVTILGFSPTATITALNSGTEFTVSENSSVTKTVVEVVVVNPMATNELINNVNGVKPAGLQWELITGGTYLEGEEKFSPNTYATEEAAFTTYAAEEIAI